MSDSDYLRLGDWNAVCFRCGAKRKASTLMKQWQGYFVCPEHWEARHPQDFVKGVPDNPSVPWTQDRNLVYVGPNVALCTPQGRTAVPGWMMPGCSVPATT